ncbi:MAG: tetratricopeptide repeat protein [Pseudanabaenaceae cyanobacterium bins.39]|nr:tetratricopeptide repeat protein [Pseudanabaenaceae cyanobacterium bins.39]
MIYRSLLITLLLASPVAGFAQSVSQSAQTAPSNDRERGFQLVIEAREKLRNGDSQDLPEVLKLFKQAIAIFQAQGDRFSEARTLSLIGDAYLTFKQPRQAIDSYQKSLEILSQIKSPEPELQKQIQASEAIFLQSLGYSYSQINEFDLAIRTYQRALAKARDAQLLGRQSTILSNIGNLYVSIGVPSKGLENLLQALKINESDPESTSPLNILVNIGFAYRNLGQFDNALKYYQQASKAAQASGDRVVMSSILNNIAGVYRSYGKYTQALENYQASLKISQELSLSRQAAITISNIGSVYKEIGQYDRALSQYKQALPLSQAMGNRQLESILLSNIGSIYSDKNEFQTALDYYNQAFKIHQDLNDVPAQVKTLSNIALSYSQLQQPDKALVTYAQVMQLLQKVVDLSTEAVVLSNMGGIYADLKRYEESLSANQRALAIHRQLGERRGESIVLSNIGDLFRDRQKTELAILFYKNSVNIREALRQELRSLSAAEQEAFKGSVAQTYRKLADLLLQQERILEAQQVLDLLKVQELDEYLQDVRGNSQTVKGVELLDTEQRFLTDYLAIQNRAIQASKEAIEIIKFTAENRSPQQQQRLQELQNIQLRSTEQLNDYVQSPAVTSILQQISSSGDRSNNANLRQFATLQTNLQQLPQKAAILYPLILDDRLEIIVVLPNGEPLRHTVNISRQQLNRVILNFRSEVRDPSSFDVLDSSQQLYQWLIAPIAADLQRNKIQTIIYAPDGQLRYLPIAALHDGKQWLVEQYSINTITAASLTNLSARRSSQDLRVLAGAFATGRYSFQVNGENFNFAGLPFAGKEVESLVAKLPNSTKLVDQDFNAKTTTTKFKQFNIIHLATHAAFVIGKPEESFVLFGDGSRASLRDVATWSLQNVDLVILSACETGLGGKLGNGTEIMGFGYQMEYAGAKAAIASLWQVSDGGTQILMDNFYNILLQSSQQPKSTILAQAQRAMIQSNNQEFTHPYYWSSFILIGNGF